MPSVELATANAAAFWTAIAAARGYTLLQRPGLLEIHGDERYGTRVLVLGPRPATVEVPARGWVIVEDAFTTVRVDGLATRTLPVMIREPAPVPLPALPVRTVESKEDLAAAERLVVESFDLPHHQPYQAGEVFPECLLDDPTIKIFILYGEGKPVGASLSVRAGETVGVYWVTTLPEFRSRGIGRALMHAALTTFSEVPMTLTASRQGKPLYDKLGFTTVAEATWWSR